MSRQLELRGRRRGEAPSVPRSDESPTAEHGTARPGADGLMEKVLARRVMQTALRRVTKNRGSPGVATARREAVALEKRPPRSLPLGRRRGRSSLRRPRSFARRRRARPRLPRRRARSRPKPPGRAPSRAKSSTPPGRPWRRSSSASARRRARRRPRAATRAAASPCSRPKTTERALVRVRDAEYTTRLRLRRPRGAGDGPAVVVVAARAARSRARYARTAHRSRTSRRIGARTSTVGRDRTRPDVARADGVDEHDGRRGIAPRRARRGHYVSAEKLGCDPASICPTAPTDVAIIARRGAADRLRNGHRRRRLALPGARALHEMASASRWRSRTHPDAFGHLPADDGGPPLAIEGRVVDEDGTPPAVLTDPRPFLRAHAPEKPRVHGSRISLAATGRARRRPTPRGRLRGLLPRTYTLGRSSCGGARGRGRRRRERPCSPSPPRARARSPGRRRPAASGSPG